MHKFYKNTSAYQEKHLTPSDFSEDQFLFLSCAEKSCGVESFWSCTTQDFSNINFITRQHLLTASSNNNLYDWSPTKTLTFYLKPLLHNNAHAGKHFQTIPITRLSGSIYICFATQLEMEQKRLFRIIFQEIRMATALISSGGKIYENEKFIIRMMESFVPTAP